MSLQWFSKRQEEKLLFPEEYQLINIEGMLESEKQHCNNWFRQGFINGDYERLLENKVFTEDYLLILKGKVSFTMQRAGNTTLAMWSKSNITNTRTNEHSMLPGVMKCVVHKSPM